MQRRNFCDEAGARSDGLMIVSILFIAAFTYIALTTNPVYTGIGVGDRAPNLVGEVWDGSSWTDFDLKQDGNINEGWVEGEPGTYYMVEFMDTNCGYCQTAAAEDFPSMQTKWTGDSATRSMPEGVSVEFIAVSIALQEDRDGWNYGTDEIEKFRLDYEHTFDYMDDQDNVNRDEWGIPGTPSYFLIGPDGIILYATPEAEPGETIWDAMEYEIPRGEA